MRDRIFIRIGSDPSVEASWIRLGSTSGDTENEAQEPAQGSLEQAALECSGCQVIVLVPGVNVLLTHAHVPSRNRQRIASAIPYLLEDQLACDVDALHFAVGRRDETGDVSAVVVDRELMDKWLARLRETGIEPDVVSVDILALPDQTKGWTLLREPEHILVRTGPNAGFAVEANNLSTYLSMRLTEVADEDKPEHLQIINCSTEEGSSSIELEGIEIDVVNIQSDQAALEVLAQNFHEGSAVNLLQGVYSRREQLSKIWRPWRLTAAMVAMLMVFHGGLTITEYVSLSRESAILQQSIEQTYLNTFPDAQKIVNPRVQMERRLEKLRGGKSGTDGRFLDLLAEAGESLKNSQGLQLQRVSYRDGSLDLSITIPNLQDLDQLKNRLASQTKLSVEIQSATARGNVTEARLQLRSKAS